MKEGHNVSSYLVEASNLRNHLIALEKSVLDKQLINIVLNALLCSYEMII